MTAPRRCRPSRWPALGDAVSGTACFSSIHVHSASSRGMSLDVPRRRSHPSGPSGWSRRSAHPLCSQRVAPREDAPRHRDGAGRSLEARPPWHHRHQQRAATLGHMPGGGSVRPTSAGGQTASGPVTSRLPVAYSAVQAGLGQADHHPAGRSSHDDFLRRFHGGLGVSVGSGISRG